MYHTRDEVKGMKEGERLAKIYGYDTAGRSAATEADCKNVDAFSFVVHDTWPLGNPSQNIKLSNEP